MLIYRGTGRINKQIRAIASGAERIRPGVVPAGGGWKPRGNNRRHTSRLRGRPRSSERSTSSRVSQKVVQLVQLCVLQRFPKVPRAIRVNTSVGSTHLPGFRGQFTAIHQYVGHCLRDKALTRNRGRARRAETIRLALAYSSPIARIPPDLAA